MPVENGRQPLACEETTSAMQIDRAQASYHPGETGRPDLLPLLKGKLGFSPQMFTR